MIPKYLYLVKWPLFPLFPSYQTLKKFQVCLAWLPGANTPYMFPATHEEALGLMDKTTAEMLYLEEQGFGQHR
jgi:hypothetical protein